MAQEQPGEAGIPALQVLRVPWALCCLLSPRCLCMKSVSAVAEKKQLLENCELENLLWNKQWWWISDFLCPFPAWPFMPQGFQRGLARQKCSCLCSSGCSWRSNWQWKICANSYILGHVEFCLENKSSCDGFEELLCYFAALLKRRGAVINEQCEVVSMKGKNQLMAGRRAFRGNWVWESELGILGKCIDTESASHAYSLQSCPFCPYFVVFLSVKILNHNLPVGENHGCLILKGAESPVLLWAVSLRSSWS